jgi:hypothetical protein
MNVVNESWHTLASSRDVYDVMIGCEIVYDFIDIRELIEAISANLAEEGLFLWSQSLFGRGKIDEFLTGMKEFGFKGNIFSSVHSDLGDCNNNEATILGDQQEYNSIIMMEFSRIRSC